MKVIENFEFPREVCYYPYVLKLKEPVAFCQKESHMRKLFAIGLFFVSLSVYAQGFYFDVGVGLGVKDWTKVRGNDIYDSPGSKIHANDLTFAGLKAGYGPFDNIPLYIVLEATLAYHYVMDEHDSPVYRKYVFSSAMVGPGIIFYPIPFIQLGSSVCYTSTSAQEKITIRSVYDDIHMKDDSSISGLAWNVSLAIDVGILWNGKHSVLLGVNYSYLNDVFKQASFGDWSSSRIGIFLKYAYRQKPLSLF